MYASGGEAIIRGEVRSEGRDCQVIYSRGGDLTIEGNVYCAALGRVPIKLNAGAGNVTIHGDVTVKREAARAEGGTLTIDGDLIIQSKQSWALYSTDGDGKITLTGTDRRENP